MYYTPLSYIKVCTMEMDTKSCLGLWNKLLN